MLASAPVELLDDDRSLDDELLDGPAELVRRRRRTERCPRKREVLRGALS